MEEHQKLVIMLRNHRPRKLDFDAPLLSTRRPLGVTADNVLPPHPRDTRNGVPFSWERIPGEPKDIETSDETNVPPPKLPPGRWQPPQEDSTSYNDGCDGDVDDDYDGADCGKKECFSDAIDIFSLAESTEEDKDKAEDKFVTAEEPNNCLSPNFIIERFLPDAQALAAASAVHNKVPVSGKYPNAAWVSRAVSVRRSYPSPKGCGLGMLFRWGLKPKLCSVKSPVQAKALRLNSQWRAQTKTD